MALDNAQFISELSITDPPGTDAIAEGDDHIRTVKRATQQSFPNVDAAVPQTAAQMGQMAIKNEVNTFTQQQLFAIGTAALPGVSFAADPAKGMWSPAVDALGFAVGGFNRLTMNLLTASFAATLQAGDGSAAGPAFTFNSNTDTGMYRKGLNSLGFSVAGVEKLNLQTAIMVTSPSIEQIRMGFDGVAGQPAYSFVSGSNMGMYRKAADQLGFATAGTERMFIDSVGMIGLARVFFRNASDTSGFRLSYATQAGVNRWQWIFEASNTGVPFHLRLNRFSSSGVFTGVPIQFDVDTGEITMGELPTSNPGGSGILWKSGGFVAVT